MHASVSVFPWLGKYSYILCFPRFLEKVTLEWAVLFAKGSSHPNYLQNITKFCKKTSHFKAYILMMDNSEKRQICPSSTT